MKPDTYIATVTFADGTGTGTVYESVVGRAYATARMNIACQALSLLRSDSEPAKRVSITVWGDNIHCPFACVDLTPGYSGDFRGVKKALETAELFESYPHMHTYNTLEN